MFVCACVCDVLVMQAQVSVKGTSNADQPEGTWYNYDNPNDVNNYCAEADGAQDGDGMMDESDIGGDDSPFDMADDTMVGPGFVATEDVNGMALLAEPTKVQKVRL